ncbi:MAG: hypothetical protein JNK21_13435 [Rhodospirillaceae bacterium]|nr:hypothetical protein [Rhodospirillaceae bacterium]
MQYTPIPPGFDFPAAEASLAAAINANDQTALRLHGWMVFAGLTQPARPSDAKSEAIWETWYPGSEVFASGPMPQGERTLHRTFRVPRQFMPAVPGPAPQAIGDSQLSFTLFNQELKDHTRQNGLHLKATMAALNASWTPQTPLADRKVKDYPAAAMSLKIVWTHVGKQGFTALPVWDEQPRMAVAPAQPEENWPRVVAIDPTRTTIPAGERRTVTRMGKSFPNSRVVPLSNFYHFAMTAQQAAQANALGLSLNAKPGDYMAVTAMHYTTKEIPNWVWATFWWHDEPDKGGYAKDRPAAAVLKGVWRNYLMDVAYDMDVPKESDGTPDAVFNPYLEARFADGVNSNCMTCHQRAVWKPALPDFLPVTRGAAAANDPFFKNGTKADFLWSLLFEGNQ